MRLMRNMATLLAVTGNNVNTDQSGSTYRIETSSDDGIHDTDQTYLLLPDTDHPVAA